MAKRSTFDDYKIKCSWYKYTKGLAIYCHNGYTIEFSSLQQLQEHKELNCKQIDSDSCRLRKKLNEENGGD